MASIQQQIVDGPSKFDLMVALFKKDQNVEFSIGSQKFKIRISVILNGVRCEDGSRESWLIEGFYTESIEGQLVQSHRERFEGYYSSKNRTGWIKNLSNQ